MAQRLPNPHRVKTHRNYTVAEIARLFGNHRNTVRQWIKQGLSVCDDQRPVLILGSGLIAFLTRKRMAKRRPCRPGQLYCVRCRKPQTPALSMAEYEPLTPASGNLIGLCPQCEGLMYRRVNLAKLNADRGELEVTFRQGKRHIDEICEPSVNSDFSTGA